MGFFRDSYCAYSDSGVKEKKKREEGNPKQNFGRLHQLVKQSYDKKDQLGNYIKNSYYLQLDSLSRQRAEKNKVGDLVW